MSSDNEIKETEATEDLEVQPDEAEGVKGGFGHKKDFGAHRGTAGKKPSPDLLF